MILDFKKRMSTFIRPSGVTIQMEWRWSRLQVWSQFFHLVSSYLILDALNVLSHTPLQRLNYPRSLKTQRMIVIVTVIQAVIVVILVMIKTIQMIVIVTVIQAV